MRRQYFTLTLLAAIVLLIFAINLILIMLTHEGWIRSVETDTLIKKHHSSLKGSMSITPWLLEDALNENAHMDDKEKAIEYFSSILQANATFLKIANKHLNIPNNADFIHILTLFHKDLSHVHSLAVKLWDKSEENATKNITDNKALYNAFNVMRERFESLHESIQNYLEKGFEERQKLFMLMVLMFILTNTLLITLLYLFSRSRSRYEKALIEQKKVFETLFKKSFDGVLIMENNRIIDTNESMLAMLQLSNKEQMLQAKLSQFSPELQPDATPSTEKFHTMVQLALEHGHHRFEWQFERSDGEHFFSEMVITPISMGNKEILHIVSHDISKRKMLSESLEQKSALYKHLSQELEQTVKEQSSHMLHQSRLAQMGEMISMIAHQWRQPLASISAISGTLTMDVIMESYKKEFFQERLEAIADLSQHLSSTIDDFRGFFKTTKEKTSESWKEMVESSLKIIGPTLSTKNITVHTSFEGNEKIHTYPNELKQVILNVIKNAEDILLEKKITDAQIWVRSFTKGNVSYLTIEDNAGGIPHDIINHIFDPYFSTKEKKDGTGLGLYMSKTIITEHCQGSFRAENTPKGALFEIRLTLESKEG